MLSNSRSYNMGGPEPIKISEVKAYMEIYPPYDLDEFIGLIQELDKYWINFCQKKKENEESNNGN